MLSLSATLRLVRCLALCVVLAVMLLSRSAAANTNNFDAAAISAAASASASASASNMSSQAPFEAMPDKGQHAEHCTEEEQGAGVGGEEGG